jgi:hypothetical protein
MTKRRRDSAEILLERTTNYYQKSFITLDAGSTGLHDGQDRPVHPISSRRRSFCQRGYTRAGHVRLD